MAIDKGGISALALSRELGLQYGTAWLHHKIQHATADRNARYQLGGVSHGEGKRGRDTGGCGFDREWPSEIRVLASCRRT